MEAKAEPKALAKVLPKLPHCCIARKKAAKAVAIEHVQPAECIRVLPLAKMGEKVPN